MIPASSKATPDGARPPPGAPALPFLTDLREALAEAGRTGRNLLVLQEPSWTNASRRLLHVLEREEALAGLVARSYVPVALDPLLHVEEDARLRMAAALSGMEAGIPTIAVLDPAGRYLVGYGSLSYEGEDPGRGPRRYPSLASVLEASLGHSGTIGVLDEDPLSRATLQATGAEVDDDAGASSADPRLVDPFALLSRLRSGDAGGVRADVQELLDGGIWDHVFGGFHRAARDERLILPHFEKPALHNLAMALVLGRLARQHPGDPAIARASRHQGDFLHAMLRHGPGIVAQASDAKRHTWMPQEFFGVVGGDLAFYAGVHFGMTQAKVQHVLYRARPLEASAEACAVDVAGMEERIGEARTRLAAFKDGVSPARTVESADAADGLSTLLMLRLLEESGCPSPAPWPPDEAAERLTAGRPAASLLEAGLRVALAAGGGERASAPALREALSGLTGRYIDPESGWCLAADGRKSLTVFDGLRLPGVGIAAWALARAGRRLGDDGLEGLSRRIRDRYGPIAGFAPDRCRAYTWLCGEI